MTDASHWKNDYQSPDSYYVGQFPFQRPGVTTGWYKNNRSTLGLDAGLTRWETMKSVPVLMKNYTYRTYGLGTGAMYNINRMIALGEVTRKKLILELTIL